MSKQAFQCSRRLFLLGSATTFAGAFLAACGSEPPAEIEAKDVPVGSAVTLGSVIVAQPTEGHYIAYSSTCPHAGSRITEVEGDTVRCVSHNSIFNIADGSVVSGPAQAPLTTAPITQDGGKISVTVAQ